MTEPLDRRVIPPPLPSDLNRRGQESSIFFALVGVAVLLGIAAFAVTVLPVSSQPVPFLIALALAPGAYLSFIIYGKDKYEPEPKKLILCAFLLGSLAVIPAGILETSARVVLGLPAHWTEKLNILPAAAMAFIVAAATEEFSKFLVLRYWAFAQKDFNEPFDGIVYGAFIGLGFATFENVAYVLRYGFGTGVIRMFTAVPNHYALGVILGYYVGKAKFDSEQSRAIMGRGLLFVILLHGAYDFFIMQNRFPALIGLTLVVLGWALKLARRAIEELQEDSRTRFLPTLVSHQIPSQ
jgi:RsiW-degrading membrane proteinase PrsW (M82 family)